MIAVSLTAVVTAAITYLAVVGIDSGGKSPSLPSAKLPPSNEQVSSAAREQGPYLKSSPPAPEKPSLASRQFPPAGPEPGTPEKSSPASTAAPRVSYPQSEPVSPAAEPPQKALRGKPTRSPASSQRVAIIPSPSRIPTGSSSPASESLLKKSPPPTADSLSRQAIPEVQSGKPQEPSRMEAQAGTKAPTPPVDEKIAERNATSEKVDPSPGMAKISSGTAVTGPSSSPPRLKISGIVWNDDPAKRRAVINGIFTNEGSVVEGLKVLEILPTKVRFLHQGRPLEISIFE